MGYRQYDPAVLQKIQQEELVVLKEFVRICNKYSINYFAVFGTAIGAVRHHGFIPWDDDMDFGMLRDDYEKFIKVAPKEFHGKFGLAGPRIARRSTIISLLKCTKREQDLLRIMTMAILKWVLILTFLCLMQWQ